MKKILLALSLFSLIACGGATKIANAPLPSCADAKADETCVPSPNYTIPPAANVRGEDWSITVPSGYEKQPLPVAPPGISGVLYVNKENVRLVVVMRETGGFSGMLESDYVEKLVSQMTGDGANVVGAVDKAIVNGKSFSMVQFNKNGAQMFVFINLQNNIAHIVMCGGQLQDTQVGTACHAIVGTFRID